MRKLRLGLLCALLLLGAADEKKDEREEVPDGDLENLFRLATDHHKKGDAPTARRMLEKVLRTFKSEHKIFCAVHDMYANLLPDREKSIALRLKYVRHKSKAGACYLKKAKADPRNWKMFFSASESNFAAASALHTKTANKDDMRRALKLYLKAQQGADKLPQGKRYRSAVFEKAARLAEFKVANFKQAKRSYARLSRYVALNPEKRGAVVLHQATMLPLVYETVSQMNTYRAELLKSLDRLLEKPIKLAHTPTLYTVPHYALGYQGHNEVEAFRKIAQIMRKANPTYGYKSGYLSEPGYVWTSASGRKIRVGFSSMFFFTHASSKMIQGVISNLDRDKFEVHCFLIVDYNKGPPPEADPINKRISQRCDEKVHLFKSKMSLPEMKETIAKRRLDVHVLAEVGMDPHNYILSFSRLATTMVATHGHASTTGVDAVDYFVSYLPFEVRHAQDHYSEKLVTFSDFSYYFPPSLPSKLPSRKALLRRIGVGAGRTLYVVPQTLYKIMPDWDADVFASILERDRKGVLVLKQTTHRWGYNEVMRARMQQSMAEAFGRGQVVIVAEWMPYEYWIALLREGVILDSYPFGGYTTSAEAFTLGSPIVTMPHERMAGRCTKAFYEIMGMGDSGLVVSSKQKFADMAVALGALGARAMRDLRDRIKRNSRKLFKRRTTVAEWEQFLEEAAQGPDHPVTALHVNHLEQADAWPPRLAGEGEDGGEDGAGRAGGYNADRKIDYAGMDEL